VGSLPKHNTARKLTSVLYEIPKRWDCFPLKMVHPCNPDGLIRILIVWFFNLDFGKHIIVFWALTQYGLVSAYQRFQLEYCLLLQGQSG
jgi:hypothetical protein